QNRPPKVKFIYSEHDAPCFYVHGARGGPTSIYDFRIDFYKERRRNPNIEIIQKDEKPQTFFEDKDEEYDEYVIVDREVEVSVILSLPAARELTSWLSKRLEEFENLVSNIEED
ncbi:MAG: hypothetical protein HXS40_08340, partial [Theionarchaea archaeon]|nr:hypothetical protein [Theionarchaea archaeon]